MSSKDHIIKVVNIPINLAIKVKLDTVIPDQIPVQYEFSNLGIDPEPIVHKLGLCEKRKADNNLPTCYSQPKPKPLGWLRTPSGILERQK